MLNADDLRPMVEVGGTANPCIVLVRHTETAWTRSGQHTGSTDLSLDAKGRAHARALRQPLASVSIALAFSSPLRRALQTADLIGLSHPTLLAELREWDYGSYEGLTTAEIHAQRPDWELFRDGCPDGEQATQVGERADRALESVLSAASGRTVAIVAHGHLLRVLAVRWMGLAPQYGRHLVLDPGGVGCLTYERGTPVIRAWNR